MKAPPQDTLRPASNVDPEQSFVSLLSQHKRILYKVASCYCRDREDRHDLMQDMVVQLWLAFPRFDASQRFSTWMYQVAMNVAISHLRYVTSQQRDGRRTLSLEALGVDVSDADSLAATDSDNMRTLFALMQELDALNRGLLLLFLDGYDADEIARMMGISASNVSTRVHRLKARLAAAFAAA